MTPPSCRAGVLSALYLFAYLSMGVVALVLGQVATRIGLGQAIDLGAGAITALSLTTVMLVAWNWRGARQKRASSGLCFSAKP